MEHHDESRLWLIWAVDTMLKKADAHYDHRRRHVVAAEKTSGESDCMHGHVF
jgi:hypothetical protein